jgi:VanZ family protein
MVAAPPARVMIARRARFLTPTHWRFFFWATVLAVLILSLMPPAPKMPDTGWDKSNHLLAFAALAALGMQAFPGRQRGLLVALLAYGGLIEGLQSLTPYRFADWADLLADAVGVLLGWGLASVWARWRLTA